MAQDHDQHRAGDVKLVSGDDRKVDPTNSPGRALLAGGMLAVVLVASGWMLGGGAVGDALVVGVAVASAIALSAGIVMFRPVRAVSWALVALGCAIQSGALVVVYIEGRAEAMDSPTALLGWLVLGYPALFVGTIGITAREPDGWSVRASTAVLATVLGTVIVGLATVRLARDGGRLPVTDRDWVGVLSAADLALAVTAWWRMLRVGRRLWSAWLLGAGFIVWGNAHADLVTRLIQDELQAGPIAIGLMSFGPVLIGLAALFPDMADEPSESVDALRRLDRFRAHWVGLVALSAGMVAIGAWQADPQRAVVLVLAMAAIGVAVVVIPTSDIFDD